MPFWSRPDGVGVGDVVSTWSKLVAAVSAVVVEVDGLDVSVAGVVDNGAAALLAPHPQAITTNNELSLRTRKHI